jgi:hypothetical protein
MTFTSFPPTAERPGAGVSIADIRSVLRGPRGFTLPTSQETERSRNRPIGTFRFPLSALPRAVPGAHTRTCTAAARDRAVHGKLGVRASQRGARASQHVAPAWRRDALASQFAPHALWLAPRGSRLAPKRSRVALLASRMALLALRVALVASRIALLVSQCGVASCVVRCPTLIHSHVTPPEERLAAYAVRFMPFARWHQRPRIATQMNPGRGANRYAASRERGAAFLERDEATRERRKAIRERGAAFREARAASRERPCSIPRTS